MKLALITDIHANIEAFEACLAAAERHGAEQMALLGDFVGYGADPAAVVRRVRALVQGGAIAVKGNHDEAVAHAPSPFMIEQARRAVNWTRAQLAADDIAFLDGLPYTVDAHGCLFTHANAHDPPGWEYLSGRAEARRSLDAASAPLVFAGHVHEPRVFRRNAHDELVDLVPAPGVAIELSAARQWLLLPGSAGQPRDGNPAACWAMLDLGAGTLTFHRSAYDQVRAAGKIIAAGLPPSLGQRLLIGA